MQRRGILMTLSLNTYLSTTLAAVVLAAPFAEAQGADDEALKALDRRVSKLEKTSKDDHTKGFGWTVPGTQTRVTIGGFIKADAVVVSDSTNGDYNLLAIKAPDRKNPGEDWQLKMHAQHSRLWFGTQTDTGAGLLNTHIEIDFQGDSSKNYAIQAATNAYVPRLRHAFATYQGLLIGQTWTNATDASVIPHSVDFLGTTGVVFARQAQVRYTHDLDENSQLAVALETPHTLLGTVSGGDSPGLRRLTVEHPADERLPDLSLRYMLKFENGHINVAGMLRQARYDKDTETQKDSDSAIGGFGMISARVNLDFGNVRFMIAGGNMGGRYFTAGVVPDVVQVTRKGKQKLLPIPAGIGLLAYEHYLTKELSAMVALTGTKVVTLDDLKGTSQLDLIYTAWANVQYKIAKPFSVGLEYSLTSVQKLNIRDPYISHRVQVGGKVTF